DQDSGGHLRSLRQDERKRAALPLFALERDVTAEEGRQLLAEVQAQPCTLVPPCGGTLELLERLEQPRLVLRADAGAGIGHSDLGEAGRTVVGRLRDLDLHTALLGELAGIVA